MTTKPVSSYVEVNGVRLHMLDWGGVGEPILIVHATGFLGRLYAPIAERLTSVGHVYSYDQRGHGDSSAPPDGDFSWEWGLRELEGLITRMGWKDIRAVGHSFGGTILGVLAAERPELISRAVIVEPVLVEPRTIAEVLENPIRERTLKRRRVFDSVESMFADYQTKPNFMSWDKQMLHDYCEYGTRPTNDGKRELKCLPEVEAKLYETGAYFDGLARFKPAKKPLLILFGENGWFGRLSEQLRAELKNARVEVIPGLGHLMAMEAPDLVATKAVEFFGVEPQCASGS